MRNWPGIGEKNMSSGSSDWEEGEEGEEGGEQNN